MRVLVLAGIALVLAGCGDGDGKLAYAWDDRRVLCSDAIDDLANPVHWGFIDDQLKLAARDHWVLLLHAHTPGVTVSTDALEHVLAAAEASGLELVTFRDLEPGPPRGALALAFDDNAPDAWFSTHELLARHHARVTFFVSRYAQLTPTGKDDLRQLAAEGHDIEPHTVNHLHAPDYVAAHGLPAYLADEVLPSFQVLVDAGFPQPAAFAYPFGDHTSEIDDAVLAHVGRVRTTPGQCPW